MPKLIASIISLTTLLVSAPQCHAFAPPVTTTSFNSVKVSKNYNRSPQIIPLQSSQGLPQDVEDDIGEPKIVQTLTDVIILGLRIGTCSLMIHHGFDKVQNVQGFSANVVAKFFGFLPGPPQFWTLSAAGTQIIGAGMLSVGVLSRPVAFSMMATMLTAVVFHLLNTGGEGFPLAVVSQHSYNFELAAMYVCVLAYFSVAGAGAFSVDQAVLGGELNFYGRQLDKLFKSNSGEE